MGNERVKAEALQILGLFQVLPRLVVFDLDYTLWPFYCWTHKTEHFQKIQRKTGIPYKSMLFFDDEDRNTETMSKMGVTSVLVENGVNLDMFKLGLSNFATNHAASSTKQDK
ncbi:hypothetical protein PR202_ga13384 [Eleusine coracana subsp. coracana]|uniref:Magnesium-dependent phosphatase 1 n=1 Tax=Eleusine coracana subsp. coracana TaxID=191504 RepID=A0AAV5CER3_ELECO|nr:hypothetical protein PR202_ga13384 [Eleusine coracana subsp. coracana]